MQGKRVCDASDSMQCRVVNVFFFFLSNMSSFCEGVLSLVNYTQRYAREREKTGCDELRQWVWRLILAV